MYPQELLDDIRNRLPISQVVGERVVLKKSGRNFKGVCPFHQEKTPSFMVSDEKQIYHCFGCNEGGNIFTFLMKLEGHTFVEAVQNLAARAGVKLPALQQGKTSAEDAEWARRKSWGARLNILAHEYFQQLLADPDQGRTARDYLEKRGVPLEFAKAQGLGAAGNSWEGLVDFFKARNAPLTLAQELGLIKKRDEKEGHFDFFRNRLMFPIFSHVGAVVGFSGRTLESDKEQAKYLNSTDSFLYSKSRSVFGIHWAKEAIRKKDAVILVEGNLDALSLVQFGIENVVAPLGTALTEDQVRLLTRYSQQFFVAFDGDSAGTAAAFRSLPIFLQMKLHPKAIVLPTGEDPDSFIRKSGVVGWENLVQQSQSLFEYFVAKTIQSHPSDTSGRVRAWSEIEPLLRLVTDPVEQGVFKRRVSEKLGFDEKWLETALNKGKKSPPMTPIPILKSGGLLEEKLLVAALLFDLEFRNAMRGEKELFLSDSSLQELAKRIMNADPPEELTLATLPEDCPVALQAWLREMALLEDAHEGKTWRQVGEDCRKKMAQRKTHNQLLSLSKEIQTAEANRDEKQLLKLLGDKKQLTKGL